MPPSAEPGPGTPGGKTPQPPLSHPQRNKEGEPFGREGSNQTLPEPGSDAAQPVVTEPRKHDTPYRR